MSTTQDSDDQAVPQHNHPALRRRIDALEAEIAELRGDLQEQRLLGQRVAHLADLVTGLIGAAARGPEEFDRALTAYADELT
jgi:hypothetical protein